MKNISKLLVVVAMFAFAFGFVTTPIYADDNEAHNETEHTEGAEEEAVTPTPYSFVAQAGDSYTEIARKAVQTMGILDNINLSQAQIIFAETKLTQAAGSPGLEVGQKVQIAEDMLKGIVEEAVNISEANEALWEEYVKFVDFNTDNVGETRN